MGTDISLYLERKELGRWVLVAPMVPNEEYHVDTPELGPPLRPQKLYSGLARRLPESMIGTVCSLKVDVAPKLRGIAWNPLTRCRFRSIFPTASCPKVAERKYPSNGYRSSNRQAAF